MEGEMSRRWMILGLFLLFLAAYGIQKYAAAAPPEFDFEYLRVVALIVAITAVIPFVLLWPAGRLIGDLLWFSVATVIAAVSLSALGFLTFWYFVASHYPEAPSALELAKRGLAPGLAMGAILILNRWLARRAERRPI
jgi:hypothetical protein